MAYLDGKYLKRPTRKKASPRKPWRAFHYANNQRTYLGNFATKEEAEAREYKENLRYQEELLKEFPNEIKHHWQQSIFK